ncbi:Serine/threonine-protein_phosphatase [Hexamita inflata]|uniref:Serine/threonine-protein phosphatase n=1 Tax=Hexamita inflata TaxID=28002 RepID=A0AA86QCI6_9EUKA|nr:Serine/threonine-protein phosphatase [Hexamita inflata]CAI9950524.1 Serine/threonine-protein phosphatase [Hexamita inflata]CAI9960785.1 Serine/threonine-protein phosphatase [Hexamita inflata]
MPDPKMIIEQMYNGVFPSTSDLIWATDAVRSVFITEPSLLQLKAPVTVVGDLHGQLYDLMEIFQISGPASQTQYLFLGDYVDRGQHSIETITLLFCLKLLYPRRVHILRGNHEDAKICSNYGFCHEIFAKLDVPREYWHSVIDTFEVLPLAACISTSASQIFCVHAGLSPALHSLSQIEAIPRYSEFPENQQCVFSDLLWSDPVPNSTNEQQVLVFEKSSRGAGCSFGMLPVLKFCHQNDVGHIFRSHQMQNDGYMVMFKDLLSTVWSAPRYTNKQNLASVANVWENGQRDYVVFECGSDYDNRQDGLQPFALPRQFGY